MLKLNWDFHFSWPKLLLLALVNVVSNSSILILYRHFPSTIWPILLLLLNIFLTLSFLRLVRSLLPQKKWPQILCIFLLLTPFLALPTLFYLALVFDQKAQDWQYKTKIILVFVASILAMVFSIKPWPMLDRSELFTARLMPSELAYPLVSLIEANRVSALTPYYAVATPLAVKKIIQLRQQNGLTHPDTTYISPLNTLRLLPLGFSWVRGAPIQALSLMQYYLLQN